MLRRLWEKAQKPDTRRLVLTGAMWLLALVVAGVVSALTGKVVDAMW